MAILTLYGVLGLALFALWLKHKSVIRQKERMRDKLGSVEGSLTETSQRLDLLSRGVDTILSGTPQVHGLLGVHRSLESAEALLFNQGIPISNSESCAIASHAAKTVLKHHPERGSEIDASITPGLQPLSERLAAMFSEAEMKAEDIELSAGEHRRLGDLFHLIERTDWAADCFQRANELDPEDEFALRSLVEIQRQNGDLEDLDRSLERILAIAPDDVEVLKEQVILLDGTDPVRVIRNRKRLEGLGSPLLFSEGESELTDIAKRARDAHQGFEPALSQSQSASDLVERAAKQILLGEIRIALESVQLALDLDSKNGPAWILHARLLAAGEGNTKAALKSIRRANALGEYTVLLESEILENDGRTDAAIQVLEEHLEKAPTDPEARGMLSLLWLSNGSNDSSRRVLDEAPDESWGSATLHVMRGRLHLEDFNEHRDNTGNHDQMLLIDALVAFDKAIEYDRESGLAWLGRARALRYQGTYNEAEVALVRARRLIPGHPSIPLEEAQLSLDVNNLEQANALAIEATTHLKSSPTVSFVRGIISARLGRLEEARNFFSNTLEIEPDHVRARLNRCSAALLSEDLSQALDDANHLVNARPEHELARLRRSEILMNHGDWSEAETELRNLLKRNAEHTMALVHLGTCLIAAGKSEQAERPLNKAIEIDPSLSEAWYQRGLLYLDFGRVAEAMSDFEGAARSDSHHIDARLRIAAVLHEGDDLDKAIVAWRKVLDIEPQNQLARRRLIECRDLMAARQASLTPKD
jgi:tetratricopeptide (TPR) repeat protein